MSSRHRQKKAAAGLSSKELSSTTLFVDRRHSLPTNTTSGSTASTGTTPTIMHPALAMTIPNNTLSSSLALHKLVRPSWWPDAHSCGVSGCNNKMSSAAARERCLGRHELVCAGYHTRLIRITSKINTPELASEIACESCLGESGLKCARDKELADAMETLTILEETFSNGSPSTMEQKTVRKQKAYVTELITWCDNMENRSIAELVKRKIGHKGWLLAAAPVSSRGLTETERLELASALSILERPSVCKPVGGITLADAKAMIHDNGSTRGHKVGEITPDPQANENNWSDSKHGRRNSSSSVSSKKIHAKEAYELSVQRKQNSTKDNKRKKGAGKA